MKIGNVGFFGLVLGVFLLGQNSFVKAMEEKENEDEELYDNPNSRAIQLITADQELKLVAMEEQNSQPTTENMIAAIKEGDVEKVKQFIALGANVNTHIKFSIEDETYLRSTYLNLAIHVVGTAQISSDRGIQIIHALIEAGARVSTETNSTFYDEDAILYATYYGLLPIMNLLVEHGAIVNDPFRTLPLMSVVMTSQLLSGIRWLINHGADYNHCIMCLNGLGIQESQLFNDYLCSDLLVNQNAVENMLTGLATLKENLSARQKERIGNTLALAAGQGMASTVQLILNNYNFPDLNQIFLAEALLNATTGGRSEIVKLILERYSPASPNYQNTLQKAFIISTAQGNCSIITILWPRVDIAHLEWQETISQALVRAIRLGHVPAIKLLLALIFEKSDSRTRFALMEKLAPLIKTAQHLSRREPGLVQSIIEGLLVGHFNSQRLLLISDVLALRHGEVLGNLPVELTLQIAQYAGSLSCEDIISSRLASRAPTGRISTINKSLVKVMLQQADALAETKNNDDAGGSFQ